MSPDQIGFGDLPEILGVSRATAARLAHSPGFPKPEIIGGRRIWSRKAVERWAANHPPRPPGRPPKTS